MYKGRLWGRIWRIVGLFVGFFLEFWWFSRRKRFLGGRVQQARRALYLRQARRFRRTALEMGGLLIKLGQFLSARVDLLPREYTDTLAGLQDEVPGAPFAEIRPILEESLGASLEELFATFDSRLQAAASLGQVYRATLPGGREVAVKVQRPGIERIVAVDLEALRRVVGLAKRFTRAGEVFDLDAVYEEFVRTTEEELDYQAEGQNADRFRSTLASLSYCLIPGIVWSHSRGKVLTLEWVEGIPLRQVGGIEAAGLSRRTTAERVIRIYLQMVMEDGFFHADPHPGNLFVLPDGRIGLVDFGMVGRITDGMRKEVRRMFIGVSHRKPEEIVTSFVNLGFVRPHADLQSIERAVNLLLDKFYGNTLEEINGIDPRDLAVELRELVRENPLQIPAGVAFLGRAVGTLVGVTTTLDPTINLVTIFAPYATRLVQGDEGKGAEAGTLGLLKERAFTLGKTALDLPVILSAVLRKADTGRLQVTLDTREVQRSVQEALALGRRALALFQAGVLLIAGILLLQLHLLPWAMAAFLWSTGLWLLGGRRKKRRG